MRVSPSCHAPLSQTGWTSILASPSGRRHRMSPVVLNGDVRAYGCRDKGLVTCCFGASALDQGAGGQGPPQPPCGMVTVAFTVQTRRLRLRGHVAKFARVTGRARASTSPLPCRSRGKGRCRPLLHSVSLKSPLSWAHTFPPTCPGSRVVSPDTGSALRRPRAASQGHSFSAFRACFRKGGSPCRH